MGWNAVKIFTVGLLRGYCVVKCVCVFELWFSQGICPVVGLLGPKMVQMNIFAGQE